MNVLRTRRHQNIVANGLARKLIARLNAGKQWPLHRSLDNDLARPHRKRCLDQRLLIGTRLFQMMQKLELLLTAALLVRSGNMGSRYTTSGAVSLPCSIIAAVC